MKELEKTKRISISAVLFLLAVTIGVLSFKKPKHVFKTNTQTTLAELVSKNYIVTAENLDSLDSNSYQLIDIRNNFEFTKGHLNGAINISIHQLLNNDSTESLERLSKEKIIVLYGTNPKQANSAWILLFQLGYPNIKVLSSKVSYDNNQISVKDYVIEKPFANYKDVFLSAKQVKVIKTTKKAPVKKLTTTEVSMPKKVITKPKKKKRMPEGGC